MNLNTVNLLLAQAAAATDTVPNPKAQMTQTLLMFGGMALLFYFLMIRPQQKKAKEHDAMLKTLRAGDKIVTTSGILGVVLAVKDRSVSIRSADTKLEILKSAVADVTERGGETAAVAS